MSWRDRFTPGGKFRDAEFWIETDDLEFGHRKVVHEFPLQNKPQVQDMGLKGRQFSMRIFVIGENYDFDRNKLIQAIETPGIGVMVHPYYGTMNVHILDARKTESTREGGKATFNLTVLEAGEAEFNFETPETAEVVEEEAEKTLAESIEEFGENFEVLNQIQEFVEDVQNTIETTLDAIENVVDGITGPITSLIRAPAEMASALTGTLSGIRSSLQSPFQALDIYTTLFGSDTDTSNMSVATSNRVQLKENTDAFNSLVKRSAIAEACRTIAIINWESLDDAINIRDQVLGAIDEEMEQPMGDGVFNAMSGLRAAIAEDIRIRGAKMPRIKHFTTEAQLPALVLAHRIHNDVSRDNEIINRNHIKHPGFVSGGRSIEVLADV